MKIGYSNIVLQNKIIEPLFEARTDFWIGKEIAKRFGKDQYLPATSEEWVAKVLSSSEDPYVSALTIDKINAANGVYPLEASRSRAESSWTACSPPLHAHGRLLRRSCGIRSGASRLRAAA